MAAPYDVKGRYQGGISSIVNAVIGNARCLSESNLDIIKFDTCRVDRTGKSEGRFNPQNIRNSIDIYKSLLKEVKKSNPQILYFHSSTGLALLKDLLAIRHAKRKTGIKTVLHIHFAEFSKIMTGKKTIDSMILSLLKKYIDKVVFLSKATLEEFCEHDLDRTKACVIYNFSTIEFSPDEQKYALDRKNEKCRFLFIGSIDQRKGILDILECFADCNNPFELHICGGYKDEQTEKIVKRYIDSFKHSIIEHGYIKGEEKRKIFLESDVLILPSYSEGLPMVIMEAFHAGCAVITTSVGAIPEVVTKRNGFVIEPGNKKQLSSVIKVLLNDSALLQQMKANNIKAANNFTIDKFICDIAGVCESLH